MFAAVFVTVLDEGDIDREFAVALEKFLGAVEWVDQPEALPAFDLRQMLACGGGFFGDDGQVGRQLSETGQDEGFGLLVGNGDG